MNIERTGSRPTGDSAGKKRAAVYARYSKKVEDDASIADQIRECGDAAIKHNWVIVDEYVRCDKARTGRTLANRPGLQELVDLAGQKPRPFDVLMFHSTSRAGRNISDTLPLVDLLLFHGVELFFVDTGLSSSNPMFRDLYIMYARNDEHYSKQVGHNVKRGQRGRVLNGHIGCARTYGYINVPIEDPVEKQAWNRPKVTGVDYAINPDEQKVILRAFAMCADGMSVSQIIKTFNREGVPAPLDGKKGKRRVWHVGTMIRLLTNKKYIGIHEYNKRQQVRNPKTGTALMIPRPESEWDIVPKPEWRIVDDELWAAAQAKLRHRKFNGRMRGGLNRSEASRLYIFSGLMRCRDCGGKINIVQAQKKDPLYGCHRHRFNGTCENGLQVSQPLLEEQLIAAMATNLESPAVRKLIVQEFRRQMQDAVDAYEAKLCNQDAIDDLVKRQQTLIAQRDNLVDAVAGGATYGAIRDRLAATEEELEAIKVKLEQPSGPPPKVASEEDLDEFLARKLADTASVLRSDPVRAKQEVQSRIDDLWLEPIDGDDGPAYRVTGDLRLFASPEDRKVDSFLKKYVHLSTSIPISTTVPAREQKAPALTLKQAMCQVLVDQPGFSCTTRILASEIQARSLYVRGDGQFANWKQINKQVADSPDLFRFRSSGVVELIEHSSPTGIVPTLTSVPVPIAAYESASAEAA